MPALIVRELTHLRHMQTDIEESPTDLITIAVAQRYSVLVEARNDTSANWAIHVNMDQAMFDKVPPTLQTST
jgi:iron transport multicopper oxidase